MKESVSPEYTRLPGESFTPAYSNHSSRSYGLWHYVWKLLRLRWVIFFSGLKRSRLRRKIGLAVVGLLILGLAVFLFWASWALLGLLRSPYITQFIDPGILLNSMPTVVLTLAFLAILLTNFGVLLQALYLAGDMDFLLSAPLPMRAVFLTKLLEAILPNFGLVCLFSLPVLFGLGASSHYFFGYYPLVVISLAFLSLAASGISSMLVMAVARVVPAQRVAEVLGFIGVILSVLFSQGSRLFSDMNLTSSQLSGGLNILVGINSPFSPLAWIGRGLIAIGSQQWLSGLGLLAITLSLAGVIFWFALSSAERLYYSGWANIRKSPRKKQKPATRSERSAGSGGSLQTALVMDGNTQRAVSTLIHIIPASMRAMVWKDFTLLRRDLRNLSQLITPLILGILVVISIARPGLTAGRQPELPSFLPQNFSLYTSLVFVLFVGWSLMLTLTMAAFSREGKNYWLVQASPVPTRTLLVAKYLVSFIPSVLFEWTLLLLVSFLQHNNLGTILYGFLVSAFYVSGGIGINLAFGVIGARLDWEDPRKMNSTKMGCLGTAVSFVYLPISIALFILPPVGFSLLKLNMGWGVWLGLFLGGIFCAACAFFPPASVRARVARIGQK